MKNLKKLVLLFLVATVSLVSCNKDDDDAKASTDGTLEGNWEYSKEGTIVAGQEFLIDFPHTEGCTKDYIEILAGTFKDHSFGVDCTDNVGEGTWSRSGSDITFVEDGDTYTMEIVELTSTTLKTKGVFEGSVLVSLYTRK